MNTINGFEKNPKLLYNVQNLYHFDIINNFDSMNKCGYQGILKCKTRALHAIPTLICQGR